MRWSVARPAISALTAPDAEMASSLVSRSAIRSVPSPETRSASLSVFHPSARSLTEPEMSTALRSRNVTVARMGRVPPPKRKLQKLPELALSIRSVPSRTSMRTRAACFAGASKLTASAAPWTSVISANPSTAIRVKGGKLLCTEVVSPPRTAPAPRKPRSSANHAAATAAAIATRTMRGRTRRFIPVGCGERDRRIHRPAPPDGQLVRCRTELQVSVPGFDAFARIVRIGQHADRHQHARVLFEGPAVIFKDVALQRLPCADARGTARRDDHLDAAGVRVRDDGPDRRVVGPDVHHGCVGCRLARPLVAETKSEPV